MKFKRVKASKKAKSNNPKFLDAYIEAAMFSSNDENDTPLDSNYNRSDIDAVTLQQMEGDCMQFLGNTEVQESLRKAEELDLFNDVDTQAGHDFWFTRNGHGVGFWESEWEPVGKTLDNVAKTFGEYHLDAIDGKIHGYGG